MSATVDERIVAAKFDASDFEKGVNKTIKKLDELKKSLDMKGTTKSVNELSEKVKTSTDSMSSLLDRLTNRLTTFTGMIKQQILSGLAQEVSDVFLKMERAVTGFVRSLGSEQVSAGMAKYEQMLASVRTMIAAGETQNSAYDAIQDLRDYSDQTSYSLSQMTDALSKFRSAGVDIKEATKSVQGIANACATAGVNATDAQRAFYNLSQAYSTGTLKYTDYRSLELLNMTTEKFKKNLLEAAEEAGTLKKLSDDTYKTINKKGEKITAGKKVTIKNIQEALKYGFATKEVMNKLFGGKYYFSEKEWSTYKKRYTDKDGNLTDAGRQKAIADAKKDFNEYAVDAYLAAREARNFTDVINTLKDVVSTGWSTTFENLFGKLEEATKFFTNLAEGPLAEAIYKIGDYRNTILNFWNGVGTDHEGSGAKMFQDIILNITEALGMLFQTFQQVLPGFDELDLEEDKDKKKLMSVADALRRFTADVGTTTLRIKEAVSSFNDWMNSPLFNSTEKGAPSRIDTIRKAISNFLTIFSIGYKVFEIGFNTITKILVKAEPIFDTIFDALTKITQPLVDLDNNKKPFEDLEHSANNLLIALDPIIKGLTIISYFAGEIGKFLVENTIKGFTISLEFLSDVLRFFIDLFTDGKSSQSLEEGKSTLTGIKEAFEGIKDACQKGLGAVKEFLGSLIKDLRALFGLTDENGEKIQNGGVFENLKKFFDNNQFIKDAKAWINQAITDVSNFIKSIPSRIKKLGANIYDTLYGLFFKEETKYNGSQLETKTVLTPLGEWMNNLITDIKNFFINLPDNIVKGVGKVFNWIDTLFNTIFGGNHTAAEENKGKDDAKKQEKEVEARFDTFLSSITGSVKQWFDDMPNKIRKALKSVGNFVKRLINAIDEFLFGKKVVKMSGMYYDKDGKKHVNLVTTRVKSGFSLFVDNVIKEVKKFITNIPDHIKSVITGAGDLISTIVNAILGRDENNAAQDPSKKIEDDIKRPFLNIDWTSVWNTIKEIGQTLLNQVARIFTGTDDVEVNSEWFAKAVRDGIEWVRTQAELGFKWIEEFIPTIPTRIANWFNGEGTNPSGESKGPVGQAISNFAKTVGGFIAGIPSVLTEFVTNAVIEIGGLWNRIYDAILGGNDSKNKRQTNVKNRGAVLSPDKVYTELTGEEKGDRGPWNDFVEKLGTLISTALEQLPTFVMQGVDLALKGLNELIGKIGSWFTSEDGEKVQNDSRDSTKRALGKVADGADQGGNASKTRLQQVFDNIKETLKTLITETIPEAVSNAFTWLSSLGSQIWEGIEAVFDPDKTINEENSPVAVAVKNFGEGIKKKISGEKGDGSDGLFYYINEGFKAIGNLGESIWTGIVNIFEGHPEGAFQTAISNFGAWIGGVITAEIPKAINLAFEAIGNLFSPKIEAKDDSYELRNVGDNYITQRIAYMKKSNKKVEDEIKKPGFWSFVDTIGSSISNAFINIGPSLLDGISKALDFLSDITEIVFNVLSGKSTIGDEVERLFGKKSPELKTSINRIGDSLRRLLIETLPKAIGAAIADISKYVNEAFSNLTQGFEEAADDNEEGIGKTFDITNKDSFFGKIFGYFDMITKFATSGTGSTIAIIVAISYLLKNLKEAMSITDELEAATGAIKWTAITIAILGLSNILSSIMDVIKEGDTSKIDAAEKIMDKLGHMLETVAWIIGLLSAGKIASSLAEIFGNNGTSFSKLKKIKVNAKGADNAVINIQNIVKGASDTASIFTSGLSALFGGLGTGAGALFAGASIKVAIQDTIDGLTTSFNELLTAVDTAIEVLDPFISKLTEAGDKVDNAKKAVDNIFDLFKQMFEKFASLYESVGGEKIKDLSDTNAAAGYATHNQNGETIHGHTKAVTSILAFVSDFSSIIDVYLSIAQFVDSLSDALIKLGNVDSIDERIRKMTEIIQSEAFSLLIQKVYNNMFDLSNRLKNAGIDNDVYSNLSQTFNTLASVMKIISESMGQMDPETSKNFTEGFAVLEKLADVFDGKSTSLLKVGSQMATFGSHMRQFYKYVSEIEGFDEKSADATSKKVSSMMEVIKAASDSARNMSYYGEGFKFLPTLGSYLPDLGENFASFVSQLNRAFTTDGILKDVSNDRLNVISSITSSISMLLSSFGELGYLTKYSGIDYDTYQNVLDGIYTNLQNLIDNPRYNKFAGVAAQLYRIINDPLSTPDAYEQYHKVGADIARELYVGIQEALDNPDNHYQPKITPVIKTEEIDNQLRDYFVNGGFTPQINSTSVMGLNAATDAKLDSIRSSLDSIDKAITDLKNNTATTADVSKAIGSWTIKTNTGALVGVMTPAIDEAIGERIWLIQRRNSLGIP